MAYALPHSYGLCTARYCSDALKLDPTMASAYYNMANSLRNRKDMPDVNHGNAEVDKDSVIITHMSL